LIYFEIVKIYTKMKKSNSTIWITILIISIIGFFMFKSSLICFLKFFSGLDPTSFEWFSLGWIVTSIIWMIIQIRKAHKCGEDEEI